MRYRSLILAAGLLAGVALAGAVAAAPALPPLPSYTVQTAHTPPVIDGKLDEPIWAFTPEFKLVDCATGAPSHELTRVKMVWHGAYLYLGALVYEKDLQDHSQRHGDLVFSESCLEIYLEAPASLPTQEAPWRYLEIDVSPTGVMYDARVTNWRLRHPDPAVKYPFEGDDSYYPPDLKVATRVIGTLNDNRDQDKGWWVEMQIPLTGAPRGWPPCLLEGNNRQQWRFNVYRVHNWTKPDQELQAFSPTGILGFHVAPRFAYLRFADMPYWPFP